MKPRFCTLPGQDRAKALAGAKLLGAALNDVVADLRLIEIADLIAYSRLGQFANIGDLVDSSAELFFKDKTLSFGWSADAGIHWDRPPRLSLEMEFRHMAVTVFFKLTLTARHETIMVRRILLDDSAGGTGEVDELLSLTEALADARLPVPKKRPSPLASAS